MSQADSVLADFYQQVVTTQSLFTIKDEKGIPVPNNSENIKAMPFWSTAELAQSFIASTKGFEHFEVLTVSWTDFADKWVPGMWQDGLCAGINWQAASKEQIDVELDELMAAVKVLLPSESDAPQA